MRRLNLFIKPKKAIKVLNEAGLIIVENENEYRIGITEKGKRFIALIDELINLINNQQKKETPHLEIKYNLSPREKRILIVLSKMQQETGKAIQLRNLAEELYPHNNYSKKQTLLSKDLSKLDALHLIEKIREGRNVFLRTTDSGMRIVSEELEKET